MSETGQALSQVGVDLGPVGQFNDQVTNFNNQNISPGQLFDAASSLPRTVGGIPGVGSRIPELGRIAFPSNPLINAALAIPNIFKLGTGGDWQSQLYATDLNAHHPKLKFLFKVYFGGFGVENFYYFVHRCDKPKIKFTHTDVNYYNFRTRVLTNVHFDPMTITFLDEIGNSVNQFFESYLRQHSGQGKGNWGINDGFGSASSSLPYTRGYSSGKEILIEQIFANGTLTNVFRFHNPRIESFEFDELAMDESSQGSMATVQFTYDAITCETQERSTRYSWGYTDLLMGGGTSGMPNAGATSIREAGFPGGAMSANGGGLIDGVKTTAIQSTIDAGINAVGNAMMNALPAALRNLPGTVPSGLPPFNQPGVVSSASDVLSRDIRSTYNAIRSGDNFKFGGSDSPQREMDTSSTMGFGGF